MSTILSRLKMSILKRLHVYYIEKQMQEQIEERSAQILDLKMALIGATSDLYKAEADYIQQNGFCNFPYKAIQEVPPFESGYDNHLKLPYVVHKGKKLYFPQSYPVERCVKMYKSYIGEECLLGGRYREKQPHQYLTDTFTIDEGDVLVDVGCAEALLSLDNIEKVSKAYLIEGEQMWIPALNATFSDYQDKVVIINKYVSDSDTENTITLRTALQQEDDKPLFIKMDIEGAEVDVLNGSKDFLANRKNVKMACCTYHHQHDGEEIPRILEDMGYTYDFSDGYMLYEAYGKMQYPYFRHGLVRARKFVI